MFDSVKELMAGRMKEYCEHKGIWINSSLTLAFGPPGAAPEFGISLEAVRLACERGGVRERRGHSPGRIFLQELQEWATWVGTRKAHARNHSLYLR